MKRVETVTSHVCSTCIFLYLCMLLSLAKRLNTSSTEIVANLEIGRPTSIFKNRSRVKEGPNNRPIYVRILTKAI